jgi:Bacteriocin-protection, YdeI or OmpD-Associated/Domain of unknown function (DUF1905)
MPHLRFQSKLLSDQGAHFVPVPLEVARALGPGNRGPLTVTINGYPFQATVALHRGRYFVAVRNDVREAAGVVADDPIAVALEIDDDIRTADLPSDLRAALGDDPATLALFEALTTRHKKEVVAWVSEAKRTETRRRRLAQALRFVQTRRGRQA